MFCGIPEWLERTTLLSPAGLDLLMRETKEAADRAGYRPEEIDRLIEKVRAEPAFLPRRTF